MVMGRFRGSKMADGGGKGREEGLRNSPLDKHLSSIDAVEFEGSWRGGDGGRSRRGGGRGGLAANDDGAVLAVDEE